MNGSTFSPCKVRYKLTERLRDGENGEEGYAAKTVHNRWANVKAFLHLLWFWSEQGAAQEWLDRQTDSAEVRGEDRGGIRDELVPFFKALKGDERVYAACQNMLKCGLREQEMTYLEWRNVHLDRGILHVEGNEHYEFKVKVSEQVADASPSGRFE